MPTQNISKVSADVATGVAAGSGIVSFLNSNATLVSLAIASISVGVALFFYIINYRLSVKKYKLERAKLLADINRVLYLKAVKTGMSGEQVLDVLENS